MATRGGESVCNLMRQEGVWQTKRCRPIDPMRKRHVRWSKLTQIDDSELGWFEERSALCTLRIL